MQVPREISLESLQGELEQLADDLIVELRDSGPGLGGPGREVANLLQIVDHILQQINTLNRRELPVSIGLPSPWL